MAIEVHPDWQVRDLAFASVTAYETGKGRLTEEDMLDLVSKNLCGVLALESAS